MITSLHHSEKIVIQLLGVIVILFQIIFFSHFKLVVIIRAFHDLGKAGALVITGNSKSFFNLGPGLTG